MSMYRSGPAIVDDTSEDHEHQVARVVRVGYVRSIDTSEDHEHQVSREGRVGYVRAIDTSDDLEHQVAREVRVGFDRAMTANEDQSPDVPFRSYMLQCEQNVPWDSQQILDWHSPTPYVPLAIEKELVDAVIPYHRRERGMFFKQSFHRKRELRRICADKNVTIRMALSLRRHHIKQLNPYLTLQQLQLGDDDTIRESSRLFEVAVQEMLQRHHIAFYSEDDQRAYITQNRPPNAPHPPTPDFILRRPIRIRRFIKKGKGGATKEILEEFSVNWVEVKMFYGASTIKHDNRSAVGCLLQTAKKYVRVFGPGAMIFLNGCGDRLAMELNNEHVMVLDCSGQGTLQLDALNTHLRTWCADSNGDILP